VSGQARLGMIPALLALSVAAPGCTRSELALHALDGVLRYERQHHEEKVARSAADEIARSDDWYTNPGQDD